MVEAALIILYETLSNLLTELVFNKCCGLALIVTVCIRFCFCYYIHVRVPPSTEYLYLSTLLILFLTIGHAERPCGTLWYVPF